MLGRIKRITRLDDEILNVFTFGSHVYGTASYGSDWDYTVVAQSAMNGREFRNGDLNVVVCTPEQFQTNLDNHKMAALECFFVPASFRLVDRRSYRFVLDRARLWQSVHEKAMKDWLRAERLLVEQNEMATMRCVWHAMRMVMFGIEIANIGIIRDFSAANDWLEAIRTFRSHPGYANDPGDVIQFFRPAFDLLVDEFRLAAQS